MTSAANFCALFSNFKRFFLSFSIYLSGMGFRFPTAVLYPAGATAFSASVILLLLLNTSDASTGPMKAIKHFFIRHPIFKAFARRLGIMPKSPYGTPFPEVMHRTLQADEVKSRMIIVGDVHGCFDELKLLLEKCSYNTAEDSLIFVGDLVNKGPSSPEVVRFARSVDAYSVRGNHDDAAISRALKKKNSDSYEIPKSYEYLEDLTDEDLQWLMSLPYSLSIPSHDVIIVHAGLVPGVSLTEQKPKNLYLMRNLKHGLSGRLKGTDDSKIGEAWAPQWKEGPHVYFGHDAKRGLQLCDRATGLDTGCVYGRKLSAMILPDKSLVQVNALKIYEEPKSKNKKLPGI